MDILLAYLAGLLTLINPCILPILPIVIGTGLQTHKHAPLALATGLSLAFVSVGLFITTLGRSMGLTDSLLNQVGASLMIAFGLLLIIPSLNQWFSRATNSLSQHADQHLSQLKTHNLTSHFIGGFLLGAVWSPCIGPTLGGAIAMASQGKDLVWTTLIMLSFALGVSSVILALGYGTADLLRRRQQQLRGLAQYAKPIMGLLFISVGLMLLLQINHIIEAWLIDILPESLQDLSVSY